MVLRLEKIHYYYVVAIDSSSAATDLLSVATYRLSVVTDGLYVEDALISSNS